MASVLLALSVAASLPNIVPAACLTLAFAIVAFGGRSAFKEPGNRRIRIFACYVLLPGVFAGLGILWPFLIQVRRAHAETNMGGTRDAVREIFNGSFLYKWTDDVYSSLGAIPPIPHSWQAQLSYLPPYSILPPLLCFF